MKKYIVTGAEHHYVGQTKEGQHGVEMKGDDDMQVSDGYHTMDELYDHRIELFIALCRNFKDGFIWRSKLHSDGTMFDGYFILGIRADYTLHDITYHLPLDRWEDTGFVDETLDNAFGWDGHTSADVLERLKNL